VARGGKREGAGRKRGSKIPARLPPVKAEIKQELRELAREYSGKALETLVKICESGENETARVAAANALLDRGYGKPSQHVDLAVSKYDSMSEDELREVVEERARTLRLLLDQSNGREH
jgi:hypothetical protein